MGEGEERGLPRGADRNWERIRGPMLLHAQRGSDTLWYRTRFERPVHRGRTLLHLPPGFTAINVWLNGHLLGSHYGPTAPFAFDVSSFLREANLLVISCQSLVEQRPWERTQVVGGFGFGQEGPSPAWARAVLPLSATVPVGLTDVAQLEEVGPVVIEHLSVNTAVVAVDIGQVEIGVGLRNLDSRTMEGHLQVVIGPSDADRPGANWQMSRGLSLDHSSAQEIKLSATLRDPRNWWPWCLGPQDLYRLEVTVLVDGRVASTVVREFGFCKCDLEVDGAAWRWIVNGRRLFMRGAILRLGGDGPLDSSTAARHLRLARQTGVCLIRLPAMMESDAFYSCADHLGMMVLPGLPLIGCYAFGSDHAGSDGVEELASVQAVEAVRLLQTHPCLAAWTVHEEPAWSPAGASLGPAHKLRHGLEMDSRLARLVERLDPSREVLLASGELDAHVTSGWEDGDWWDVDRSSAAFVSSVGAASMGLQAADEIQGIWPCDEADPRWSQAGFDSLIWRSRGLGGPADHATAQAMAEASWDYQGEMLEYMVGHFRRLKFQPCGGVVVRALLDSSESLGFGVAFCDGSPKPSHQRLVGAFKPTKLICRPREYLPRRPFGFAFAVGHAVNLELWCVCDQPGQPGPGEIRWNLQVEARGRHRWLPWKGREKRVAKGRSRCTIPPWDHPAELVDRVCLSRLGPAAYRFSALLLDAAGGEVDRLDFRFLVGRAVEPGALPMAPWHLDRGLRLQASVEAGRLKVTLRNHLGPLTLERLRVVAVADMTVDLSLLAEGPQDLHADSVSSWEADFQSSDVRLGDRVLLEIKLRGRDPFRVQAWLSRS